MVVQLLATAVAIAAAGAGAGTGAAGENTIIFGNVHGDDDGACGGITDSVVCAGLWWHHRLCGAR